MLQQTARAIRDKISTASAVSTTLVPKTKVRFHTINRTLEYVPSPEDQEVEMGTRELSYVYI